MLCGKTLTAHSSSMPRLGSAQNRALNRLSGGVFQWAEADLRCTFERSRGVKSARACTQTHGFEGKSKENRCSRNRVRSATSGPQGRMAVAPYGAESPDRGCDRRRLRTKHKTQTNEAGIAADLTRTGCVHRRFPAPKGGYVARRSRRHPVPPGGWSGASTFPSGLSVPRSVNPWGPCASPGLDRAEAFSFPSTPSRTNRPNRCRSFASCVRATRRSEDHRDYARFQAAQLSPSRRLLQTFLLLFRLLHLPRSVPVLVFR